MGDRWICAVSEPRQEIVARQSLDDLGFRTFLPLLTTDSPITGYRTMPLFPGYLFLHIDISSCWQQARYAPGVRRLLGSADSPSVVPRGVIDELRERCGPQDEIIVSLRPRKGERVKILSGSFQGWEGICKLSSRKRVQVLISLFNGRNTIVDASPAAVAVV